MCALDEHTLSDSRNRYLNYTATIRETKHDDNDAT